MVWTSESTLIVWTWRRDEWQLRQQQGRGEAARSRVSGWGLYCLHAVHERAPVPDRPSARPAPPTPATPDAGPPEPVQADLMSRPVRHSCTGLKRVRMRSGYGPDTARLRSGFGPDMVRIWSGFGPHPPGCCRWPSDQAHRVLGKLGMGGDLGLNFSAWSQL